MMNRNYKEDCFKEYSSTTHLVKKIMVMIEMSCSAKRFQKPLLKLMAKKFIF